jgi:hypothetical protein
MENKEKSGAWAGTALKVVYIAETTPASSEKQGQKEAFDALRSAYNALETAPEDDARRIAFLKSRLAWRKVTAPHSERGAPQ